MSVTIVHPPAIVDADVEARLGNLPDRTPITAIGHSDDVNTNLRCLYHGMLTDELYPAVEALLLTPAQVKVSSTDANDTSAGTGARTVRLTGLDASGDPQTENVALQGQTGVTTTGTWKAVTKAQVLAAGSTKSNAGQIWVGTGTVTAGVPATKLNSVEIGTNVSATCLHVVPAGKRLVVTQLSIYSGDTTKTLNFQFYQYSAATGLWYEAFDVHGTQGSILLPVVAYPALTAGDAVMMRCAVNTGTAKVTGAIAAMLVDA